MAASALKQWCAENQVTLAGDEGKALDGPRALRSEEFDALMELIDDTFRGPDWPRPTHAKLHSLLLNPATNLTGMRVFVQGSRPIAHFGFYVWDVSCGGVTLRLASVGSVCTHPDFREQGLATRLAEDALRLCEAQGVHLMLISGGRGLYRRQGAVDVGKIHVITLAPGEIRSTGRIELEPWSNAILPFCAAMYQREPFRFYRSLEDWQRVARSGSDMNRGAQILLIREDGVLRAYAAVYSPEEGESGYLEYAGSRHALWDAIPELIERFDLRRFLLSVPAHDLEWASLSAGRKVETTTCIPGHTARLVDVQGFWSALQPYLVERLGEIGADIRCSDQPPYHIQRGQQRLRVPDIGTLTQLMLGPHTPDIDALLGKVGELGEDLRLVFPLAFGFPGLNFV